MNRSVRRMMVAVASMAVLGMTATLVGAQTGEVKPAPSPATQISEIPDKFVMPEAQNDYLKRIEMIRMRDGVRLYTVIIVPKAAKDAPIVLTRTPNGTNRYVSNDNPSMEALLPVADIDFARAGYIRVFQDIRGKNGSEGAFELTRPPRGPLNATDTDESTDAWDTIDWLVKNVPQSNGKVGMFGTSTDGSAVVIALLERGCANHRARASPKVFSRRITVSCSNGTIIVIIMN